MRKITEIVIHCSATRPEQDVSARDIDLWHRRQGWDGIGYHFFIKLDGTIEAGRPIEIKGAHTYGHNAQSIGICYAGGAVRDEKGNLVYTDTRTSAQQTAIYNLVRTLLHCYPSITTVAGHNDYANKACPCFDVHAEFDPILKYLKQHPLWQS